MAELKLSEIRALGKEYRVSKLVHKVFNIGENEPNFMVIKEPKGLFMAEDIIVNKKRYGKENADQCIEDILDPDIVPSRVSKIFLRGKYVGQTNTIDVNITSIEKSEEFGGQPAGGKRVNKGLVFERELHNRMVECLTARCCRGKYANSSQIILEQTAKENGPLTGVELEGGRNQPRPINASGTIPYIEPKTPSSHGEKLTDITINHRSNKKSYLSLKFGSTLTFMNAGVGRIFKENEMKTGQISDPVGLSILKALGIDNEKFCSVFNNYGSGKKVENHIVDIKQSVDSAGLKSLLQTAIGANYWMVHGNEGGSIDFWYMSAQDNSKYATINSAVTCYYGGKDGKGKRIDIEFENSYFKFKLNIRNKQGGTYPSHIMLDYVSKAGLNKTRLTN